MKRVYLVRILLEKRNIKYDVVIFNDHIQFRIRIDDVISHYVEIYDHKVVMIGYNNEEKCDWDINPIQYFASIPEYVRNIRKRIAISRIQQS